MAAGAAKQAGLGDSIILEARVNGVRKGDIVAILPGEGGGAWIKSGDFARLGIGLNGLPARRSGQDDFLQITDSRQLRIRIDLDRLEMLLEAAPELLGKEVTSLSRNADLRPSPLPGGHGFINYSLAVQEATGSPPRAAGEFAGNLALGEWVLRSEHSLASGDDVPRHLRLRSFVQRDWPDRMVRVTAGDVSATSGMFGRAGPIGGFNVARVFELQPGFVTVPTMSYAGSASSPSSAEIYVDGAKLRTIPIKPGLFEFRDLYYFAGLRNVEIAVVDAAGRRQTMALPFYFSDQNLAAGLHEFSYSFGRLRRSQAAETGYGAAGGAGYHRYGWSDSVTVGVAAEHFAGYTSLSGSLLTRLGQSGTLAATLAHSRSSREPARGEAARVSYAFTGGPLSFSAAALLQGRDFGRFETPDAISLSPASLSSQLSASVGFAIDARQSAGIDLSRTSNHAAPGTSVTSFRHSLKVSPGVSLLSAFARRSEQGRSSNEISLALSINLDRDWNISSRVEARGGQALESVRLSRSIPNAEGAGGRVSIDRTADSETLEGFAQYNGAVGSFSASARQLKAAGQPGARGSEFRMTGSIATVDGGVFATRQIDQSFAVVDAAGLPGVRVYQNNQFIGRTRDDGKLIAPSLGAYSANQMRIDDRDIPLDVELSRIIDTAVPRTYMGTLARFSAKKISAAGGRLYARRGNNRLPVDAARIEVRTGDRLIESSTGPDGDFYIDELGPGEYRMMAESATLRCSARFTLGDKQGPFTDLGEIECDSAPLP